MLNKSQTKQRQTILGFASQTMPQTLDSVVKRQFVITRPFMDFPFHP